MYFSTSDVLTAAVPVIYLSSDITGSTSAPAAMQTVITACNHSLILATARETATYSDYRDNSPTTS
jgi:hypothetical protein